MNNKINLNSTEGDNMDETENTYQGCLELEYDNSQSDFYSSREISKTNKNYNNYNDNNLNKKEKKVKFNINDVSGNNYFLAQNPRYQEKEQVPQQQPIMTKSLNYAYNLPEEISQKNKDKNFIKKTNKNNNYYKENTKFMKKSKNKNIKNIQNQAIEYETIKENYSIKHCNCVLEYSFREDQNIDSEIVMEDKSKSIENFNNDKNQMVFEIFDGHGGDEMSTYLQNNLAQIYKQNLLLNK